VANCTPRPLYPRGRDPVAVVQEAVRAPGPVWTGAKHSTLTRIWSPDCWAHNELQYRLCCPGPPWVVVNTVISGNFSSPKKLVLWTLIPVRKGKIQEFRKYVKTIEKFVTCWFAEDLPLSAVILSPLYWVHQNDACLCFLETDCQNSVTHFAEN
jgi:hypothetical protein